MKAVVIKKTKNVKVIEITYTVIETVKVTVDKNMDEEVFEVVKGRKPAPTTEEIRQAIQSL